MNPYDKMRNALIEAKGWLLECLNEDNPPTKDSLNEAIDRIDAALSEPPRQCDVGTADEQMKRQYDTMCNTTNACPDSDWSCRKCFAQWAQSPYSESNGVK